MRRQTMSVISEDNVDVPKDVAKNLAPKLKLLYSVAAGSFLHHISQVACKSTHRQQQQ